MNLNSTQNHIDGAHVLGSIVETCQTVTTQDHSDSAPMKCLPGDIIEARQDTPSGDLLPAVLIITAILATVTASLIWIEKDNPVRGNDVQLVQVVQHFD